MTRLVGWQLSDMRQDAKFGFSVVEKEEEVDSNRAHHHPSLYRPNDYVMDEAKFMTFHGEEDMLAATQMR